MFKQLSIEFKKTMKSGELGNLAKEVGEAGVDALLDQDGFVKDLPLVGSLVAAVRLGASVRDRLLGEKILRFLNSLSEIDSAEREAMLEKLEKTEGFRDRVGEKLLEILDRITADRQPEMIGKVFAAFARGTIGELELKRLIVVVERTPPHELIEARAYHEASEEGRAEKKRTDPMMLLALQSTGMVDTSAGWDAGVFHPTPLMDKFLELELDR